MSRQEAEHTLYIQLFSHLRIDGMGAVLDEDSIRSDMLTKLLVYLFCYRKKEITTQELVEVLWQDEESDNPAGALKNLVYRLRTMLKKKWPDFEFIITGRGAYKWNTEVPVKADIEEFENIYEQAARAEDIEERIAAYKKAITLYKGDFLPKISAEYWVATISTYYHSMYISAVKTVSALLEQEERYEEMEAICSVVLQLDNLDEGIHCYLVKSLLYQKKIKLAAQQYKKAVDILYENLGVSPSEELRAVYEEILKQTHDEEKNISLIQQELNDDVQPGAFLCEYGVFKKTYHLEKRRAERLGISVYLSLVTIEPVLNIKKDSQAYLNIINEGMERLEWTLLHSLRSGDVVSKYSGSQFIILLPTCQYETAKMVMERIETAYYADVNKKLKVRLKYSLDEMDFAMRV